MCPRTSQTDIEMVSPCDQLHQQPACYFPFASTRTLLWGKLASRLDKVSERAGLSLERAVLAGPVGDVLLVCAHCAVVVLYGRRELGDVCCGYSRDELPCKHRCGLYIRDLV